jgi:hypothetical protein
MMRHVTSPAEGASEVRFPAGKTPAGEMSAQVCTALRPGGAVYEAKVPLSSLITGATPTGSKLTCYAEVRDQDGEGPTNWMTQAWRIELRLK